MSQHTNGPTGRGGSAGAGSSAAAGGRRLPAWLIPLLLVILAIILLLLALSRCGSDDDTTSGAGATTPASATVSPSTTSVASSSTTGSGSPTSAAPSATVTGGPGATGTGQRGTLFAGNAIVLPLSAASKAGDDGNLSAYVGEKATATAVQVQSVPADEGFWVGSSATDRVWVQLTGGSGESPYKVKKGDAVSFTGMVAANGSGFAAKAGVTDAEGKKLLSAQGQHIAVAKSALKLAS